MTLTFAHALAQLSGVAAFVTFGVWYVDSGDHLHPNDAGNQAMADAIPFALLGL